MGVKTGFRGSFTALVTPFKNGSVDEAAFRSLVAWQIAEGTNGLVPVGTTGESPTLSHDEHKKVVEWCLDEAKGRVPVIAGAGSNSTREAIELAEHAEQAGADAVLQIGGEAEQPRAVLDGGASAKVGGRFLTRFYTIKGTERYRAAVEGLANSGLALVEVRVIGLVPGQDEARCRQMPVAGSGGTSPAASAQRGAKGSTG